MTNSPLSQHPIFGAAQRLLDSGILLHSREMLERKLVETPDSPQLMERLMDICRQLGDLSAAATWSDKISRLVPNHQEAGYLHQVLSGRVPAMPITEGICPSPFVLLHDFLDAETHRRVFDIALSQLSQFKPLKVRILHGDEAIRSSNAPDRRRQIGIPCGDELEAIILPRITAELERNTRRLQIEAFEPKNVSMELHATRNGGFGLPHRDNLSNPSLILAFAYYFHSQPKAFEGGDLLLFDSDRTDGDHVFTRFTRLIHRDNTLTLFPTACSHQITRVDSRNDDVAHSRFAVVGWVER